jgi:hypothetical protein
MEPISTTESARRLLTTKPTVHRLLESGALKGKKRQRGSRFVWDVDPTSVAAYLATHGPINGKRQVPSTRLGALEVEFEKLREQVRRLTQGSPLPPDAMSERDDLRAETVSLRDALARTREALDLQRQADEERSAQVHHLLEAAEAGERVDALHRKSLTEFDDALAGFTQPGHVGQMTSGQG